jgi:hypothetical protein
MKNLYQALLKSQQEFGPILKSATNPAFKSKYAELLGVVETVTETLNSNGLVVLQPTVVLDGENVVKTLVIHAESGECLEGTYKVVTKDPTDPQKVGAGLTYARRYALMSFFGLAAEDDDGNTAATPAHPSAGLEHPPVQRAIDTQTSEVTDGEPVLKPNQYYNEREKKVYDPGVCEICSKTVPAKSVSFSQYKFSKTLCYTCQGTYDQEIA